MASALHVRGENPWGYPDHWYRNVHASRAYGGSGGSPFSDRSYEQARIVTISVWSGNPDYIHAIQVTYGRRTAAKHGGNGGTRHDFEVRVNQGEKITEVRLRVGWHVDRIGFKTNHGRDLGAVGGMGGKYHVVRPPFIEGWTLGCYLVSIEGRAGAYVDQLTFYWKC
ncbi:griffithsin-like [Branchiostoma floridae]|uniref:Griffithsin-like n=1 Tax=Branchiostoma floridae TaxID=7739 RepID=A0A9J7HSZ5_BRAFL|nr:griffithsin-like [Branchiostoma floridae]